MSLEDRLRLKLNVKTEISLCMATMLDHPYIHSTTVLCDTENNIGDRLQPCSFKMYAKGSDYFCSVRWFMHALSYSTIHIISSHVYEELVMCMSHVYEELVMCMRN